MTKLSNVDIATDYEERSFSEDDLDGYLLRMTFGFLCGIVVFFVIGVAIVQGALAPLNLPDPVSVMIFFCVTVFGGVWVGMAFGKIGKYKLIMCGGLALLAGALLVLYGVSGMEMPALGDGAESLELISEVEAV